MRLLLLFAALFASCSAPAPGPTPPPGPVDIQTTETVVSDEPAEPAPAPEPMGPTKAPQFIRTSLSGIAIDAVAFDSRSHQLVVADQAGGPGSQWPDSRAAGKALQGIAAINAGFFTPEGQPLGKLVSMGSGTGAVNRASSLGAGFYLKDAAGRMSLIRRENFRAGREALQSGPFLIEDGRLISGLSEKQSSARTFIAWDGGTRWLIARTGSCSLASLATALKGQSIGGTELTIVLNLDGGRSSEIWVSAAIRNGPRFERPFWNKPVRNFLVLEPKH